MIVSIAPPCKHRHRSRSARARYFKRQRALSRSAVAADRRDQAAAIIQDILEGIETTDQEVADAGQRQRVAIARARLSRVNLSN